MAWFSIAGVGGLLTTWITSVGFWMIACIVLGFVGIGALKLRIRRKMNKPVIEMYDLGNGVFDFRYTKGGWFKKRFTLFHLWDYGSESLFRLKDMTPVFDVGHNDYRKINDVNGLVVVRDPIDPKFCIPISKFKLEEKSMSLMAQIAPADMRDAAVLSIEQTDGEMKTKWEQYAPILTVGFVAIVLVFSILLIAQYGKHNIDVSGQTLRYIADKLVQIGNSGAAEQAITNAP